MSTETGDGERRPTLALVSEVDNYCSYVGAFLTEYEVVSAMRALRADVLAGWGQKALSGVVRAFARMRGLKYLCVEDGFLRSVGLGKSRAPLRSIIVDDEGIFYDASRPSQLERLLLAPSHGLRADGAELRQRIIASRLSKYSPTARTDREAAPSSKGRLLLVDQVRGDRSVTAGLASADTFTNMLEAALAEGPAEDIIVRPHPDVVSGYARGFLASQLPKGVNVDISPDPLRVLESCRAVWTVTSQFGFEAILRDVPVTTFGVPFYAGYGLTRDRAASATAKAALARRAAGQVDVDRLVSTCLVDYCRYADPKTRTRTDVHTAIDLIIAERQAHGQA